MSSRSTSVAATPPDGADPAGTDAATAATPPAAAVGTAQAAGAGAATVATTSAPAALEELKPLDAAGQKLWHAGTLVYDKFSLRMLFFWLLWGDFTIMLRERSVGPTFQLMLKQLDASDFVLGLLVGFIPHAVSMVLGPVISFRSDRHRSPRGRRIPYLLISTPLCFVGMVGLAFSPKIGTWAHPVMAQLWGGVAAAGGALPGWFPGAGALAGSEMTVTGSILTMVAVFWTLFEICAIASGTIFNALVADVVPRTVIGRFFGLFRMVSLADGMLFSLLLIQYAETHYVEIFCAVGLLFAVSFGWMCFKVKEGDYPPAPPVDPSERVGAFRGFLRATRTYLRDCFSHSYYRWLTLSVALSMMAFVPINTFSIYFFKSLGMTPKAYGWFSAIQFAVSFAQAYPIGWLADRFHPIRLIIVSFFLHATTVTLAFFFVQGQTSFGVFHVLTGSCAGFWLTAYSPFLPAMLPRAKYATFVSAITVVSSLGTMIIAPAVGLFLDHVVNRQYRYVYLWCLAFDVAALVVTLVVYRKFKSYGGVKNYVPPDVDGDGNGDATRGAFPVVKGA